MRNTSVLAMFLFPVMAVMGRSIDASSNGFASSLKQASFYLSFTCKIDNNTDSIPGKADPLVEKLRTTFLSDTIAEASKFFEENVTKDNLHFENLSGFIDYLLSLKSQHFLLSKTLIEQLCRYDLRAIDAYIQLGELCERGNHKQKALKCYESVLALGPGSIDTYILLKRITALRMPD